MIFLMVWTSVQGERVTIHRPAHLLCRVVPLPGLRPLLKSPGVTDINLVSRCLLKRLSELVRAGSGLVAAGNALHAGDSIIHLHSAHEACDSLGIAIAASDKFNIFDCVTVQLYMNSA